MKSLYTRVADITGLSIHRLRLTYKSPTNAAINIHLDPAKESATLDSAGLKEGSTVHVKDLGKFFVFFLQNQGGCEKERLLANMKLFSGPQLAWRTVYIIEYLGPLLIHPLTLFYLRPYIYKNAAEIAPSSLQYLLCYVLVLHFIKRELETIFVHQFSLATMPARNIFRNSAHYWILSGLNVAYWVYSPSAKAATTSPNPLLLYPGLLLFIAGELANFNTHMTLKRLRKPGSTAREIPRGFGFNWVTCPNYFFEVVAWVGIWLVSGCSWSIFLFTVVGASTMYMWAKGKERRYRKLFGDKYKKKRAVLVPFLL